MHGPLLIQMQEDPGQNGIKLKTPPQFLTLDPKRLGENPYLFLQKGLFWSPARIVLEPTTNTPNGKRANAHPCRGGAVVQAPR